MRNLLLALALSTNDPGTDHLKKDFESSFEKESPRLLGLVSSDLAERKATLTYLDSADYEAHIGKTLRYMEKLSHGTDIFDRIWSDADVRFLEEQSRGTYESLLSELYGLTSIAPENELHFFLNSNDYLKKQVAEAMEPKAGLDWQALFMRLRAELPRDYEYRATMAIDPTVTAGLFSRRDNQIRIGSRMTMNAATIMGMIHEFGHSLYSNPLLSRDEKPKGERGVLIDGSFNEAYADVFAYEILRDPRVSTDLFTQRFQPQRLEAYFRFRNIFVLRYHLLALRLERHVRQNPGLSVAAYKKETERLGSLYLRVDRMPALIPILPQTIRPGYLPSYLLGPILYQQELGSEPRTMAELLARMDELKTSLRGEGWKSQFEERARRYVRSLGNPANGR